ncbi:hypothetical protein MMC08_003716 [Hypocenomyce scalaris]|nr:hypothetical protein [Hypocenomyce scalaris]
MSVTTTDNPITLSLRQTLGDYEVHVTGESSEKSAEIASPNSSNTASRAENPLSWPRDHHRIPDYRPINTDLSAAERPSGSHGVESAFITVMFTGVAVNAHGYGAQLEEESLQRFFVMPLEGNGDGFC